MASNSSSPPTKKRGSEPPTERKAERRTTDAPAMNPNRDGPGMSGSDGSGLRSSSAQIGSSNSSGPTKIRAEAMANLGCASNRSAAWASDPGSHQVSSSQSAT